LVLAAIVIFGVRYVMNALHHQSLSAASFLKTTIQQKSGKSLKIGSAMDLWAHQSSQVGTSHTPGALTIQKTSSNTWRVVWTYQGHRLVFADNTSAGTVSGVNGSAKRFMAAVVNNTLPKG
jgi:hypothetical protein